MIASVVLVNQKRRLQQRVRNGRGCRRCEERLEDVPWLLRNRESTQTLE